MSFDFPMVLANHTPLHTFVQFLGSPGGIFLLLGAGCIIAMTMLRYRDK